MSPRVLYVNHVSTLGGAERTLCDLLRHLPRTFDALVACPGGPQAPLVRALEGLGLETAEIPAWRPHRRPFWRAVADGIRFAAVARALRDAIQRLSPDLVHCNSLPAALLASRAAGGVPWVWQARDLRMPGAVVRAVVRGAARVIAISQGVAQKVEELAPAAAGKTTVIYNGVDVEELRPQREPRAVRESLGLPAEGFVVGTVGQLVPWKKLEIFVAAAEQVVRAGIEAHFLVVGADVFGEHGQYARGLKALAQRAGLGARIRWLGWREDVPDLLRAMAVYLHPGDEEPLGRVVLEAMAVGTPVVVAGAAGPAEVVRDGETGLVFRPGDAASAAEAVGRLAEDGALGRRLAAAAQAQVQERFTAARMAGEVAEVYAQVLGR